VLLCLGCGIVSYALYHVDLHDCSTGLVSTSACMLIHDEVMTSLLPCNTLQVIKNHFASEYIYNKYKDMKTCDIIEDNPQVWLSCSMHRAGAHMLYVPVCAKGLVLERDISAFSPMF